MIGAMRADHLNAGLAVEGRRELEGVRRFSHEAMTTVFEVHAAHPDQRYAAQAAQAAFDLTDRLERELSRFLPNSDISRINKLAAGATIQVGPAAMECLVIARHMFDLTGGAFDVSIGTGLPSLHLDPDACLVRATTGSVRIDLGGIGKGYAVDLMAELLEEWGLDTALVHGGFSSVLALEAPPGLDGWPLTLSDPNDPTRVLARLSVRQTALGASGRRKGDHIVEPRTGAPARGRRAAWIAVPRPQTAGSEPRTVGSPRIAPATVADALTTAFLLLGPEAIDTLCERSPGVEAWVLQEPNSGGGRAASLLHFGGSGPGYTSASSGVAT
jgi:thiamine biosynthesis lipoprotein